MIKNVLIASVSMILMGLLMGCARCESHWYPVVGGCINLNHVTRITTKFSMTLIEKADDGVLGRKEIIAEDELITAENIEKAKKKIASLPSTFNNITYDACIVFRIDNKDVDVHLGRLDDWTNNASLCSLLDSWLAEVDRLRRRIGCFTQEFLRLF